MENTLDYAEILSNNTVKKSGLKSLSWVPNNSETKSTSKSYPQFEPFNKINLLNIMPTSFDIYLICF